MSTSSSKPQSVSVLPAVVNLAVYAGDTLAVRFTFTDSTGAPVDMTGSWAAQIRVNADDPDPPVAAFAIDSSAAATGIIMATLDATDSRLLTAGEALVWDIQQTTGSGPRTTHRGTITATEDVTRP